MEQYKEFKKKLYNIINESTLFFNEKGVADALLADYVDECAAGLLKVALEEYGINELKENLKKYQQSIETKYNECKLPAYIRDKAGSVFQLPALMVMMLTAQSLAQSN